MDEINIWARDAGGRVVRQHPEYFQRLSAEVITHLK